MKNLTFMDDFKTRVPFGVVLYIGKNLLKFKENIFLVPYDYFFKNNEFYAKFFTPHKNQIFRHRNKKTLG